MLIRHAKSDWSGEEPDDRRPLAPRGRRQAPETGAWIAAHVSLDLAVVSPALRARATWDLVAAELPVVPPVVVDDRVYAAWGRDLLEVVRGLPDDAGAVALVGHNPGLEDLAEHLTGRAVWMPTSSVAVLDLPGAWVDAGPGASLRASGRPPEWLEAP